MRALWELGFFCKLNQVSFICLKKKHCGKRGLRKDSSTLFYPAFSVAHHHFLGNLYDKRRWKCANQSAKLVISGLSWAAVPNADIQESCLCNPYAYCLCLHCLMTSWYLVSSCIHPAFKRLHINTMKGMGWNETQLIEGLVSKILPMTSYYYNPRLTSLLLNSQLPVSPPLQWGPGLWRCGGGRAFGCGPAASRSCIWWGWGWEVSGEGVCGCLHGASEFRVDGRQVYS